MKNILAIACYLVVAASIALAVEAPVLVSPDGLGKATIAPTAEGYGLVWWDYRDAGSPGRP